MADAMMERNLPMTFARQLSVTVLFALFVLLSGASLAHAQSAGIKLVPATIETRADPKETIVETLVITNLASEEKEYYLYKRDIKGVDPGGVPIFAEESEPTGYEVSAWITLVDGPILIPANGEYEVPVTIDVPEDASPGSHFGGIFISVEAPKLRETGAGVGYEVASIVSIRISGDINDEARIRSFSTNKLFYGSKNVDFIAKVENLGNILIRPRGPLTITGMFGGPSTVLIVNDSLKGVFPGVVEDLAFSWQDESLGFGRYEAILALAYDGENGSKTIDKSLVFWIFPTKIIVPLLLILLALFGSGYFLTKLYVNRAIMRAAGSRRISTQRYRRQVGISRFAFVFTTLLSVLVLILIVILIFFV